MATLRPRVYIETSVISYLCAELSLNLRIATQQQATREWWRKLRSKCDAFASDAVLAEASLGNPEQVRRRLDMIALLQPLDLLPDDDELAKTLVAKKLIPQKARTDAIHLAVAVRCKMDILLTWNLKHLANPVALPRVYDYLVRSGLHRPAITTPADLMESQNER